MQTVLSCNTHAKRCCKELNLRRKQSSKVFLFSSVWTTLVKRLVAHLASCILLTVSGSFGWTWSSLGYFKSSLWQCRGLFNAAEKYTSWKAIIILVNYVYRVTSQRSVFNIIWIWSKNHKYTKLGLHYADIKDRRGLPWIVVHYAEIKDRRGLPLIVVHYAEIKDRRGLPLIVVQSDWKGKSLGWDKTFTADVAR